MERICKNCKHKGEFALSRKGTDYFICNNEAYEDSFNERTLTLVSNTSGIIDCFEPSMDYEIEWKQISEEYREAQKALDDVFRPFGLTAPHDGKLHTSIKSLCPQKTHAVR